MIRMGICVEAHLYWYTQGCMILKKKLTRYFLFSECLWQLEVNWKMPVYHSNVKMQ